MNRDDELPGGEQNHADQQDAADHRQQDHEGVRTPAALGFFERREDRQSAGVFGIRELHHTVVLRLVETKNSVGILSFERLHGDDFIFAEPLAGLIVCESSRVEEPALDAFPLGATGVGAGGTFLAGVSKRSGLAALTAATDAAPSAAAHLPVIGDAGGRLRGTVAVVTDVAGVTFTLSTVTLAVT